MLQNSTKRRRSNCYKSMSFVYRNYLTSAHALGHTHTRTHAHTHTHARTHIHTHHPFFLALSASVSVLMSTPVRRLYNKQTNKQTTNINNTPRVHNSKHTPHLASKSLGVRMSARGTSSSLYTSTSSFGTYCEQGNHTHKE